MADKLDFPRWVFTVPGKVVRAGGTYGQQIVNDESEYQSALKAGWSSSLPEAAEAYEKPKAPAKALKDGD